MSRVAAPETFQWPFDSGRGVMSYFAGALTEDFDEFITKVVRSEKVVKQFEEAVAAAGGVGE